MFPFMETRLDMIFDPNVNPPVWRDRLTLYCDRAQAQAPMGASQAETPSNGAPSSSPSIRATPSPAEKFLPQEPLPHVGLMPLEAGSNTQTTQTQTSLLKSSQACRALIVEDDPDNRFYAECAVEDFGYQWVSTGIGEMAVPLALACRPDVILLDIWLQETTGFEVIRQLQQHSQTLHIPIIAVTALSMPRELNQISTAGFDGYLLKPYLPKDLSRILQAHLPQAMH